MAITPAIEIRACQWGDLPALEAAIPSGGRSRFHHRRFDEQQAGISTYLIAWIDRVPVGHLNLRWSAWPQADVRAFMAGAPELDAIGVWPEALRSGGIGAAMIDRAERLSRLAGRRRAGLAVAVDNPRARALYERLGYAAWPDGERSGTWTGIGDDGTKVLVEQTVTYLAKDLG